MDGTPTSLLLEQIEFANVPVEDFAASHNDDVTRSFIKSKDAFLLMAAFTISVDHRQSPKRVANNLGPDLHCGAFSAFIYNKIIYMKLKGI